MRMFALVLGVAVCASHAHAQPAACNEDAQCYADFYCETGIHFCQRCVHCEDLKREAPPSTTSCVKSVVQCGPCLPGLTRDHGGDVSKCAAPDETEPGAALPVYIWSIIGCVVLAMFLVSAVVIVYVLRRTDLFRISTRTWLGSGCGAGAGGGAGGDAPDPPPPYNPYTPYAPVRTDSPVAPEHTHAATHSEDETARPFIKRSGGPPGGVPGGVSGGAGREAEASQSAVGYNPPSYVRVHPLSPVSPHEEDSNSMTWPAIHDEDTAPHEWTPNDHNGNSASEESAGAAGEGAGAGAGAGMAAGADADSPAGGGDLPTLLAAARNTALVEPPAKKMKSEASTEPQRYNDDNNNGGGNREGGDAGVGVGVGSSSRADAPSFYFNIVQINNTKL